MICCSSVCVKNISTLVSTYSCMQVHIYTRTYVRVYACTYICMYACMYVCMYIRTYVCMYMLRTYVCVHIQTDLNFDMIITLYSEYSLIRRNSFSKNMVD